MHWKQLPCWLTGGIIAGGITLIPTLLLLSCEVLNTSPGSFLCLPFLFLNPMFPLVGLFDVNPRLRALPGLLLPIISTLAWALIGSLVGALVGFVKSKRIPRNGPEQEPI